MKCFRCGSAIPENVRCCPECGALQKPIITPAPKKKKRVLPVVLVTIAAAVIVGSWLYHDRTRNLYVR